MKKRHQVEQLADVLCEALMLINDYVAAQGPIFDPPSLEDDVRPLVRDAQAALRNAGLPGGSLDIRMRANRVRQERGEAAARRMIEELQHG